MTPEEARFAALLRAEGRTQAQARVTSRAALPVLAAFARLAAGGPTPSVREIADEAGVSSTSTVGHHLRTLAELKLVTLPERHQARSIQLTDLGLAVLDARDQP